MEIRPQAVQWKFLRSSADIAIIGGAAGGGKTWALLLEAVRNRENGKYRALILRRTYPQIKNPGGMWDESENIYPLVGGRSSVGNMEWTWPSGATVTFGHMHQETSYLDYKGAQLAYIGFDQLEDFTERQFFYMMSRVRSMSGVRKKIRGTVNPDPDSFVASLLAWWIDQETGFAIPERSGVVRWFVRSGGLLVWADHLADLLKDFGPDADPRSITFIPATVYDNPALMTKDPSYLGNLKALLPVDQARLLGGNWKVRPSSGKLFNRAWFETVDAAPAGGEECRFWDYAATKKKSKGDDPDFTASVKVRKVKGVYFVLDVTEERVSEVDGLLKNTTDQDVRAAKAVGARYRLRWEIEPGSAGIRESRRLTRMLAPVDARGVTARGEKFVRSRGLAAQAQAGNVMIVRGAWNEPFLTHMHHQPDFGHDDIHDAATGSFEALAGDAVAKGTGLDLMNPDPRFLFRRPEAPDEKAMGRTEEEVEAMLTEWEGGADGKAVGA